ncbi:cyclin-B2-1-like [Octopus vulgaris]|uniref:Cyclin-B2-1-like n=2 Tax=Octopus TaxID=6643 RepID=A0AA36BVF1_OCTVU|nr:cyclin-B2-1-like [Octopus vulgaris]
MVYKGKTSDAQELMNLVSSVDPESSKEKLKKIRSLIYEHFNIRKLIITPYTFFNYFRVILKLKATHDLYCITNYILELSQYDDIICVKSQYKPSLIATAALHTGIIALKLHHEWLSDLSILTPYTGEEKELISLHKRMLELLKAASKETKYSSAQARYYGEENNCISQIDYSNV